MAGEAEHVSVHALHVDRYRTCRLRCIDNQKGAVCVRYCTDFGDIEQVSSQIGCMRADNGLGFRSKERFQILIADIALTVRQYQNPPIRRASADHTADGARNCAPDRSK